MHLVLRAFMSNLRALPIGAGEKTALEGLGIANPTVQRYMVWRRSMFLVVILITALSAALATWHELGLFEDDPDEDATAQVSLEDEAADLLPGVTLPPLPTLTSSEEKPKETAFAKFADLIHLVALYSVPLSALAAFFCWTRLKLSHRILLAGWMVGSLAPMLIALCPWSWWGYDMTPDPDATAVEKLEEAGEAAKDALEYLIMLLPIVMSLIPGAQRACLRIKTLLPESMLPGWFVVSAAPLYSLLILVMFIVINQVASNLLFLGGMFLILVAPLVFLIRADVLTRPLVSDADYRKLFLVRLTMTGLTAAGGVLVLIFILTQEVFGMKLVGFGDNALLYPTDVPEYALEGFGRSLFITALGADLFMQMNLSTWQYGKAFDGTPAAAKYDEALGELARSIK